MASYRCGVVLAAGLLLMGSGIARAQQQSSTGPLTYDQMLAQAQQAKAQQDADAAKHGKKSQADAVPATAPAAADATPATAAASTAPTPAAAEATPAAQGSDAAATPATVATPATAGATVEPSSEAPAAATAEGANVPPGKASKDATKDDANFKPVKLGSVKDAKGGKGKPKVKKEKPPKLVPVNIVHGELTVDGLIAKAGLNFQILDLKYLYIWVPGLGTAIISNQPFAGATLEGGALDGNTLTVTIDGHTLQVACDRPMLVTKDEKKEEVKEEKDEAKLKTVKAPKPNKKDKPLPMYVSIDRNWQKPSPYPEFGYGDLPKAPYSWPGTLADLNPNGKAPPLPDNLKQHPESVKLCGKNGDPSSCREVSVPLVLGKSS